jgi:putative membrane protein
MVFWFDHGMDGWGWFAMSVGMMLFWALVVAAVVMLVRSSGRSPGGPRRPARPSPEQLLAERFARGEIDEEEYQQRLAALRGSGPPTWS